MKRSADHGVPAIRQEQDEAEDVTDDPRVKVAEESKTQKAVNHDGLTNEATQANVAEFTQKYQTEPKNEAQAKQQRKPKGPKM